MGIVTLESTWPVSPQSSGSRSTHQHHNLKRPIFVCFKKRQGTEKTSWYWAIGLAALLPPAPQTGATHETRSAPLRAWSQAAAAAAGEGNDRVGRLNIRLVLSPPASPATQSEREMDLIRGWQLRTSQECAAAAAAMFSLLAAPAWLGRLPLDADDA